MVDLTPPFSVKLTNSTSYAGRSFRGLPALPLTLTLHGLVARESLLLGQVEERAEIPAAPPLHRPRRLERGPLPGTLALDVGPVLRRLRPRFPEAEARHPSAVRHWPIMIHAS